MDIDISIRNCDDVINKNLLFYKTFDRPFLSQNILSQLRNFVEAIAVKLYGIDCKVSVSTNSYEAIKSSLEYINSRAEYKFLTELHRWLKISMSHRTLDGDSAERVMLKYYEHLLIVKKYMRNRFNMDLLGNISLFPINIDNVLSDYYNEISKIIDTISTEKNAELIDGRYYVQKVKPFFVDENIYYEVTLSPAKGNISKFDRITAFTNMKIMPNYSIKVSLVSRNVALFDEYASIKIINKWEVSIRPCEIENFFKIFGKKIKITKNSKNYKALMFVLTYHEFTLLDFAMLGDTDYNSIKKHYVTEFGAKGFFGFIDECRNLFVDNRRGSNILKYLLHNCTNRIIKDQLSYDSNINLSNLYLTNKSIPFDEMPFSASLVNHNPRLCDLLECFEIEGKEHELFSRYIRSKTENEKKLYISTAEIDDSENIKKYIDDFNEKLYYTHVNRCLIIEGKNIFIRGYEEDTKEIIKKLVDLSSIGVKGYTPFFEDWYRKNSISIDCDEKLNIMKNLFTSSKIAIIYGAAGTGKTTLISYVADLFVDMKKVFLANTHPAVENLRRRINDAESDFKTIKSFLSGHNHDAVVLIIDECSMVSNSDMQQIMERGSYELIVLVGDIYQIEPIVFGNWFEIAKTLIPEHAKHELYTPYRTKSNDLKQLWNKVRNVDDDIDEYIALHKYAKAIDKTILEKKINDEIILCLNYDGLYGINNINRFLQNSNPNPLVEWGISSYKVGDPILFSESTRFSDVLYNNLKGNILNIVKEEHKITFEIEIDKAITELDSRRIGVDLISDPFASKSIVRFSVKTHTDSDDDDDEISETVVPFVVSYAVSIHKSQGLEYESVKVVLTNEVGELISHNIFYTAITRARKKLTIYWTPECQNKIIASLRKKENKKDAFLIKRKIDSE